MQHQRIVIGLRKMIRGRRVKHLPVANGHRRVPQVWWRSGFWSSAARSADKRRTKVHRAGEDSHPLENASHISSAPPMSRTSPCVKRKLWQMIHALRMEKWSGDEFDGIGVAAIHQQIIGGFSRLNKHRMAAVQRQDSERGGLPCIMPAPAVENDDGGHAKIMALRQRFLERRSPESAAKKMP